MTARALIIGAARSGSGKTSVSVGLMRALARRGVAVRGAKSGPDYIDPGFHQAATGAPGVNLDSWAMPPELLDALAAGQAGGEALVIESAMGLFDGVPAAPGRSGAAADLARRWGVPVALVLDVSGQSQTAAAIARGFAAHDPGVRIAAVLLNQAASPRHEALCREAVEALGLPVLGAVRRDPEMGLPERHLGLVQAREHAGLAAFVERLADVMERSVDIDALLALAAPPALSPPPLLAPVPPSSAGGLPPPGQRIALADDAAFSFVYPHLLQGWRRQGAEIVPFAPLADEPPDPDCDACWLPGGYPELHAGRLAAAGRFRDGLRRFAETRPVHGECGGFMALGATLEDAGGVVHQMAGLLGHGTSFARRRMNLGYRRARLLADGPLGRAGQVLRGHEFHYARVTDPGPDAPLAELEDARGAALGAGGGRRGRVTGSFFHVIASE